jgi:hypothetical protein
MKKIFYFLIVLLSIYYPLLNAQDLYINEIMASNGSVIRDPQFNNYADWIEIYNNGPTNVNIKDYYLSDDAGSPQRYKIPSDIIVPSGGFVLIWVDGMDTGNHTNFSLSASGEFIGLYSPALVVIDTLTFGEQQTDISQARYPDGGDDWYKMYPSSPAVSNPQNIVVNRLSEPVFSTAGGFYSSSVELTLSHPEPDVQIFYTIDGSVPDESSTLYTTPVTLDTTVSFTARAFKQDYVPSREAVNTYFINFQTELPVFSLSTDPDNFFSDTSGIYVSGTNGITGHCSTVPRNWNCDWERPVTLEFYEEDKSLAFNVKAGVKIYGGCSRIYDMKSLAFYFRGKYGYGELDYRLFPDIPVLSYEKFILRSSSQDWWRTMFRDGMAQTLIEQGMDLAYQEYRPSVLFINGQYWGIHNIREKMDDHYLKSHYGIDTSNIDLIEISKNVRAANGDAVAYNEMINFLSTRNMALQQNYDYIKTKVDIDNFIDYHIAEIYSANGDYPGSNVKLWRERTSTGKWRWMVYDLDFTFGGNANGMYYSNTLELATAVDGPSWPNPPWSTLMLRKMLDNAEFRNEFIQRFAVHMNTTYRPDHVAGVIDSLGSVIESEIPRHKTRWIKSVSYGQSWYGNVQLMRDFAHMRQPNVRQHFYTKYNISGSYKLTIGRNNPDWGKVFTHTKEVKENNSIDTFFNNIPLRVRAMPMPGYRFVRWEGISNETVKDIEILSSSSGMLTAVFEPDELNVTSLVINEINYRSSPAFDTEDWIELYNPVGETVDIAGWSLRDSNPDNIYTFPAGAFISGNGYLVAVRDTIKFKGNHLNIQNVYGDIGFGLSSSGDIVMLFDNSGNLVDSVNFGISGDWPSEPNGNGPTLSLTNPQSDNSLGINWRASGGFGTPGRLNDTYTKTEDEEFNGITEYKLYDNYPNPFNPVTIIRWQLPEAGEVSLKVYDLLGREAASLVEDYRSAGIYETEFNASDLPSGIYFYHLNVGAYSVTKKMVLLK